MIPNGTTVLVTPGNHFKLLLLDGSLLEVECTADDFSIAREDDTVAYTRPISGFAKRDLGAATTGRN